jgi:hypothetical protein
VNDGVGINAAMVMVFSAMFSYTWQMGVVFRNASILSPPRTLFDLHVTHVQQSS